MNSGLSVPDMSDHCLEVTVGRIVEGDVFDYIHKISAAALARLNP